MNDSNTETFDKLDAEALKQEIKSEAVKEAQDALISRLQGDKADFSWEAEGKKAPADYKELFNEVDKRTVKPDQVSEIVKKELEADRKVRDEAETKRTEDSRKKQLEDNENKRKSFDNDWYDLVKQGKMPAVAKEVQERINKGEKLTKEEITADDGLKARLDLAQASQTSGKSAKLAFYEDFDKQPAGAKAPVLGGRPSTPQKESKEEYTREDIQSQRKEWFGF